LASIVGCGGTAGPQKQPGLASSSLDGSAPDGPSITHAASLQTQRLRSSVATRPLSGRAYVITNAGETPIGDAETVIRALSPAALSGDGAASYGIHLKIRECAGMTRPFKQRAVVGVDSLAFENCRNLSAEQYDEAALWLHRAAAQGHLGAQLLYAADPEATLGTPADMLRNPDAINTYKETSMAYLQSASADGSVDALIRLADAYRIGVLTKEDDGLAYAYYQVVEKIDPRYVSQRRMESIRQKLSDQEVQFYRTKGMKIHGDCCTR